MQHLTPDMSSAVASGSKEFLPLIADPQTKQQGRLVVFLLLLSITMLLVFVQISLGDLFNPSTWEEFLLAIAAAYKERPINTELYFNTLLVVVGVPLSIIVFRLTQRRRLLLSPDTIVMSGSPVSQLLGLQLNWSLNLRDIDRAWINKAGGTTLLVLEAETKQQLNLNAWLEKNRETSEFGLRAFLAAGNPRHLDPEDSAIVQYLRQHGLAIEKLQASSADFDLLKNSRSKFLVVLLFCLIGYALLDVLIAKEVYVGDYPFDVWIAISILAALPALWAKSKQVPTSVVVALAILLVAAGAFAAYPATLRLNALLDDDGIQSVTYQRIDDANLFKPVEGNWPELRLPDEHYWSQLEDDLTRDVMIRRGGLGFVQVNYHSLYPEIRAYYKNQ
ncbi:MAG: hypothetical protein AAF438_16670 [Pseudomonadota bacterium]